jgi:hypothetical protein
MYSNTLPIETHHAVRKFHWEFKELLKNIDRNKISGYLQHNTVYWCAILYCICSNYDVLILTLSRGE